MLKPRKPVVNAELGRRVAAAREEAKLSQEALAEAVGYSQTGLAAIELGQVRRPTKLLEIASATGKPIEFFLGRQQKNSPTLSHAAAANSVGGARMGEVIEAPVVGVLEAGAFREVEYFDDIEPAKLAVARDPRFPSADLVVYLVSGDSMTEAGIHHGDALVCVDFVQSGLPLRDKLIVVAERRDGHRVERTVKEVRTFRDRFELTPRSKNPIYRPIVVPLAGQDHDTEGYQVQVTAVVLRVTKEIPV